MLGTLWLGVKLRLIYKISILKLMDVVFHTGYPIQFQEYTISIKKKERDFGKACNAVLESRSL